MPPSIPMLSILVPTLPWRRTQFAPRLLDQLEQQAAGQPVELLCLYDNFVSTTGRKRNLLRSMALGRFCAFVDDDDRVADDYIRRILDAIARQPDAHCIVFDALYCPSGAPTVPVRFDVAFQDVSKDGTYLRKPNHLMVWQTELAKTVPFRDATIGEDTSWAGTIARFLAPEHQARIDATLYYYEDRRSREWKPSAKSGTVERWLAHRPRS